MNGEGVAQGMRSDRFANAAPLARLPAGTIDTEGRDRLAGPATRKQPLSGLGALPVVPEQIEEFWRQHDIAVFPAFALLDPDEHALAVDRGRCEADGFGNSQSGRVTDGQNHTLLQVIPGAQEARHLILAGHDGKLLRLTARGDIVRDDPWSFECDGVEQPDSGER